MSFHLFIRDVSIGLDEILSMGFISLFGDQQYVDPIVVNCSISEFVEEELQILGVQSNSTDKDSVALLKILAPVAVL
jgi:hypothetical protein